MAPIAIDTTTIPIKTRQVILILFIILGFAIICALVGYCVVTLTKFYRLCKREKERAKKTSDIESSTAMSTSPVPTFPPTAYVSPRERLVQRAIMSGWPVGLYPNVSHHSDAGPTFQSGCLPCGFTAGKPVSDANVSRPGGEVHQTNSSPIVPASPPSEEAQQRDSSITVVPVSASVSYTPVDDLTPRSLPKTTSAPDRCDIVRVPGPSVGDSTQGSHTTPPIVAKTMSTPNLYDTVRVPRPSVDDSTSRSRLTPPLVARMMSAPGRYDTTRVPTITMDGRYPIISSNCSRRGDTVTSSEILQLATTVGDHGDVVTNATHWGYELPVSPLPVFARSPHNNVRDNAPRSLTNLSYTEPQSMLAYQYLP